MAEKGKSSPAMILKGWSYAFFHAAADAPTRFKDQWEILDLIASKALIVHNAKVDFDPSERLN